MFFNINEDKRKMFLEAAISEFTEKPFNEVSVNTIVKKAKISRGSFYTYFENLEALFNYLMDTVKKERFSYARELMKKADYDYFQFVRDLFVYDFDAFSQKGTYSLFRNYIHYIQEIKKGSLKNTIIKDSLLEFMNNNDDLNTVFHYEEMNLSKEDFIDTVEVILIIMVNTFITSENEKLTKDEANNLFYKRLSYLENGIRK